MAGFYEKYHENKAHTSAGFPYNTYVCTIPLDFRNVPLHWHDDTEIIYIKKGRGIISIDLVNYEAEAGDILFVLPGSLHSIRSVDNCRMEYENIIFDMNFLFSRMPEKMYDEYFTPLLRNELNFPTHISPITCMHYADAAHFLDMADACCRDKQPAYQIAVKGFLFCFFASLFCDCLPGKPLRDSDSIEKLKTVLTYIEEHYAERLTIEDMAQISCFSSSHFMRFFKQNMGKTFTEYLNDYRLSMAARLMKETKLNITEIAQETGFDNLSYFNRIFKRKYNMTPCQYRKIAP